jgi:RHS repeat-associated protein
VQITRAYDHLNRLKQEDGGGGAATAQRTFGYDPAGQLTTAGDYTLEYNDRGLLTKLAQPTGQPTTMAYDEGGNLTQRIDAAGTANFTWDNANRLGTATDPVTGRTLTYGYDKANRVTSLTAANPASTQTIGYDDLGRATSQVLKSSTGTELAKITYGWDLDDNLTTKTTTGLAGAGTNTYTYDHANRLTSWTAPGGATTAYEWDAAGNRTKAGDKTYTYDERNRLTSGDDTTYTYTPRGTLATQTKNGTTTQLTFDAFDRLIADGDSLYAYDAFDRVTSRISGTTKQTHHYSGPGNDLAAISAGGSVQATYARDPFGALLGLREGTDPATATLSDFHGDLVATHSATAITSSTAYDPFGAVTAQTGAKGSLGYQGEYTDPDTGKVNMHARWYQPGTGTFTSRDTATLAPNPSVQANRYTYANASPLTGTDPTGHYTVIGSGAIAGPGNSYTPGTDNQTAAGVYAEYGILAGSSSGNSGGTCIGSCYGGGSAVDDTCVRMGFCGMPVEVIDPNWLNQVEWNPGFSEEEARRVNVVAEGLGAGRDTPDDDFWASNSEAAQEARRIFSEIYDPMDPDQDEKSLWQAAKDAAGVQEEEALWQGIVNTSAVGACRCHAAAIPLLLPLVAISLEGLITAVVGATIVVAAAILAYECHITKCIAEMASGKTVTVPFPKKDSVTAKKHANSKYIVYEIKSPYGGTYKYGISRQAGLTRANRQVTGCSRYYNSLGIPGRCSVVTLHRNVTGYYAARTLEASLIWAYVLKWGECPDGQYESCS